MMINSEGKMYGLGVFSDVEVVVMVFDWVSIVFGR